MRGRRGRGRRCFVISSRLPPYPLTGACPTRGSVAMDNARVQPCSPSPPSIIPPKHTVLSVHPDAAVLSFVCRSLLHGTHARRVPVRARRLPSPRPPRPQRRAAIISGNPLASTSAPPAGRGLTTRHTSSCCGGTSNIFDKIRLPLLSLERPLHNILFRKSPSYLYRLPNVRPSSRLQPVAKLALKSNQSPRLVSSLTYLLFSLSHSTTVT